MKNRTKILRYQELSTNAWPARTIVFLNGWVLRISEGITKRANSVLPIRYIGENLLEDIKTVEKIYKEKNLAVIFQLPDYFEPDNLQETLLSLGYEIIHETLVMTSKIGKISAIKVNKNYAYSIENNESEAWFEALATLSNYGSKALEGQKRIIGRIPFRSKAFCCVQQHDQIIGIGLAVIERTYLGIFDLIVHPKYRRQGIAQSIIAKIGHWGKNRSVNHIYLQVQGDNSEAIALYNKIGLEESYRYRYLIQKTD
ncbi:MAG: GNAT family N-acetyltransferase [Promethearchaeota archaeon]